MLVFSLDNTRADPDRLTRLRKVRADAKGFPLGGSEPTFCHHGWAWQLELLERNGMYWSNEKGRGFDFF